MRKRRIISCIIVACTSFLIGCSASLLPNKLDKPASSLPQEIVTFETPADTSYRYEEEETLLISILQYYLQAQEASSDFDFGLAETKIDSAFMMLGDFNIDSIEDDDLVLSFKSAVYSLGKELGIILNESERISKEDYTSWIDELENIEDFKSGRWSDEELRKIVIRISLQSDVPIEYNDQIKKAIYFFQTNRREEMEKWLRRSTRYLPLIKEILTDEGIPQDMAYLSMIESGFNPKAYSRARAVGLWQFINSTGRLYGLKRDQWVDERRDPVKSTKAAAHHLRDLHNIYNDWNLAMAAYNCGPSRITRQFNRSPNIEFWEMSLPRETRNYVPFFMAGLIIAKEPELFGFENIDYEEPLEFDTYEVHPYTSLKNAAQCADISLNVMRALNPELRKDRAPIGKNMYSLKIPKGKKGEFAAEYAKLKVEKYVQPRVTTYYVKRGDTLSGISRKFGVSVTNLMRANNLRNKHKLRINQRLNIPDPKRNYSASYASSQTTVSKKNATLYAVRKNDSLSTIAEKFRTTVSTLQKLNNMGRRTRIYMGQKLYVPQSKTQVAEKKSVATSINTSPEHITYIIQAGDSLYEIARQYGVNYKDIKRWNKIKDHRKIKPGQKIIVKKTKG